MLIQEKVRSIAGCALEHHDNETSSLSRRRSPATDGLRELARVLQPTRKPAPSTMVVRTGAGKTKTIATDGFDDSLIARLERALALAAYIVLRHGSVYAPYVDRLEKELEVARRNDPIKHAKRILETYTDTGGRNAMRLSHSRFCSSDGPNP
jgi:hypothetical protein